VFLWGKFREYSDYFQKLNLIKNNMQQLKFVLILAAFTVAVFSCSKGDSGQQKDDPKISVTGVTLDAASKSLTEGETFTLSATVLPENASNKKVSWSSNDENVATVDNGVVKGIKDGTATITVKTEDGGKTATCQVTVSNKTIHVTGVSLNKSSAVLEIDGNIAHSAQMIPTVAE